jgi:hypothetical protein
MNEEKGGSQHIAPKIVQREENRQEHGDGLVRNEQSPENAKGNSFDVSKNQESVSGKKCDQKEHEGKGSDQEESRGAEEEENSGLETSEGAGAKESVEGKEGQRKDE